MNKDIINENKKEDKKHFKGYIILLVLSFFIGMGSSLLMKMGEDITTDISEMIAHILKTSSIYANVVLTFFSAIAVIVIFRQAKNMYSKWDGEDEYAINNIEKKCSYIMMISGIAQILSYIFIAIGFLGIEEIKDEGIGLWIKVSIFILGIIVSLIFGIVSQQKIVNFEKELNPEKKGSVFDFKFHNKWLESCDEAEKVMIYEAAFASYMSVQIACSVLWVICVIGMITWNFGLVPVCMVGAIWMVSMLAYCLKAMKLENK